MTSELTVIGVGNPWRGDDGAGLEVARRLAAAAPGVRVLRQEGHQSGLLEQWRGADGVVVVDAASSGASPGTVHRFDAVAAPTPAQMLRSSTHAFGVAEAVELARVLDRLPHALTVYAIEAASFELGIGLTPAVDRAVDRIVQELSAARQTQLTTGA